MSPNRSSAGRSLATSALLAGLLLIPGLGVSAQEAYESAVPAASPTIPMASPDPAASPSVGASPVADIVFHPLPAVVAAVPEDIPTVSVEAESVDDLEISELLEFTLGHCGLLSPIDLDGSLWQAVGGAKADGSAIAEGDDAEIGELINATSGTFVIVDEDAAHFTTVTGTILDLVRAPGAVDYPLCM